MIVSFPTSPIGAEEAGFPAILCWGQKGDLFKYDGTLLPDSLCKEPFFFIMDLTNFPKSDILIVETVPDLDVEADVPSVARPSAVSIFMPCR